MNNKENIENIVEINNLKKSYEDGNIKALNGVDLDIRKGEFISIIGPSGSGKSTLLNMLGSLDIADEGTINVAGYDLKNSKDKELNNFRSDKIGFIFQLHNLIPNLSVLENIEIPMFSGKLSSKERRERAYFLLDLVNLSDKSHLKPTKLSGGERQRVAIARSLANDPSIILADEPTGSLDSKNSENVMNLLMDLHKKSNVTLIVVTHDLNVAKLAERSIEVLDGKVLNIYDSNFETN
jgi:putative ABC transport system ATP-binding protein